MEAIYIKEDNNRGKQISLSMVLNSVASAISIALAAYIIPNYGYFYIGILIFMTLLLSSLPFIWLKGEETHIENYKIKDGYKYTLGKDFKDLLFPLFAEQLRIIMGIVFVPLFLYTTIGDFKVYGYISAAVTISQMIIILFSGHKIDQRGGTKVLKQSFYLNTINSLIFMTLVYNPITAFLADGFNRITYNIYESSLRTNIHKLARKRNKRQLILFGSAYQMTLCIGELITLPILALLTYFIGNYVFHISFMLGAYGCYVTWQYFKKLENTTN